MAEIKINFEDDIPAYKKKSKKKGQPRADHKHIYETVLLTRCLHTKLEHPSVSEFARPTKVCTICGRIGDVDWNDSFWTETDVSWGSLTICEKKLNEMALSLPKWYVNDFDKFATRMEEDS